MKADATGESERIRGDGDAERNRIYAEAFNKDPEFFGFSAYIPCRHPCRLNAAPV
jgi:hypothetical protein